MQVEEIRPRLFRVTDTYGPDELPLVWGMITENWMTLFSRTPPDGSLKNMQIDPASCPWWQTKADEVLAAIPDMGAMSLNSIGLNYYGDGTSMSEHVDVPLWTMITFAFRTPKCFGGGDLVIDGATYPAENNVSYVLMKLKHEVTEVTCDADDEANRLGRFSLSTFWD